MIFKKNLFLKITILLFDIFIIFSLFIIFLGEGLPTPNEFFSKRSIRSTVILDRNGEEISRLFKNEDRVYISIKNVPNSLKYAILAAEDRNFYRHSGFSPFAMGKCLYYAITNKLESGSFGKVCGGSTLTQQLIKNTVLKESLGKNAFDRSILKKIKEMILSYKLEKIHSKDEILEMYMNEVPLGGVHYGVESAARAYFGKKSSALTLAESSFLAGIIQAPTAYNPFWGDLDKAEKRQEYVLTQMEKMQTTSGITIEEINQAKKEKLSFDVEFNYINAPHFVLYIREYLIEKYGISAVEKDGLIILTSLDKRLQNIVEQNIKTAIPKLEKNFNIYNAGGVLVDPKKGEILAFMGSADFNNVKDPRVNGQNYIVSSLRQYAGLMTPYTYATAINKGYGPWLETADIANYSFSLGYPNYDGKYFGPMTARQALGKSRNNAMVYMADLVNIAEVDKMQRLLGIKSNMRKNARDYYSALGLMDSTLMENIQAYSVFANEGQKVNISPILKIYDSRGNILEDFTRKDSEKIMEKKDAFLVNYTLCDLDRYKDRLFDSQYSLNKEEQLCGKTGLSTGPREYSAITYDPNMVLGVWAGNSNNELLKLSYQENPALDISKQIFKQIFSKTERKHKQFIQPPQISKAFVCIDTGQQVQNQRDCLSEETVIRQKSKIQKDFRAKYYICNTKLNTRPSYVELSKAKKYNVVTQKTFINKQLENNNQKLVYEKYLKKTNYIFKKPVIGKCDYPLGTKEKIQLSISPNNKTYSKSEKIIIAGTLYNPERYKTYNAYIVSKEKLDKGEGAEVITLLNEYIPNEEKPSFYFVFDIPPQTYPGEWIIGFNVESTSGNAIGLDQLMTIKIKN